MQQQFTDDPQIAARLAYPLPYPTRIKPRYGDSGGRVFATHSAITTSSVVVLPVGPDIPRSCLAAA